MKWVKVGRTVSVDKTVNTYEIPFSGYTIESRKVRIPHANGRSGFWWHTSYFVIKNGEELIEKFSLGDAKEYVENALEEC